MAKKLFRDLQKEEKLFILQPITFTIHEASILLSVVHPKSLNKRVWVLEFFLPFKHSKINEEAMKNASDLFGVDTKMQVMVDGNQSMTLISSKVPTMIATTRIEIEVFLGTATPTDIGDYLNLKMNGPGAGK